MAISIRLLIILTQPMQVQNSEPIQKLKNKIYECGCGFVCA